MRRRPRRDADDVPERLRRYVPVEWDHDPQAFWDAWEVWRDAHPDAASVTDILNPPDVPFDASQL